MAVSEPKHNIVASTKLFSGCNYNYKHSQLPTPNSQLPGPVHHSLTLRISDVIVRSTGFLTQPDRCDGSCSCRLVSILAEARIGWVGPCRVLPDSRGPGGGRGGGGAGCCHQCSQPELRTRQRHGDTATRTSSRHRDIANTQQQPQQPQFHD